MIQNPIELTREVFQNAYDTPNRNVEGRLQFLGYDEPEAGDVGRVYAILSSGDHRAKVLINYNCERRFRNRVRVNDILKIDLRLIQERDFEQLCLQDFAFLNDGREGPIGRPAEFIPHVRANGQLGANQQQENRVIANQGNNPPDANTQVRRCEDLNLTIQKMKAKQEETRMNLRNHLSLYNQSANPRNEMNDMDRAPQRNLYQSQRLPVLLPPDLAPRGEAALVNIEIPRPDDLIRENIGEGNRRIALQPPGHPRAAAHVIRPNDQYDNLRRRDEPDQPDSNYNQIADLVDNDRSWILKAKVTHKTELNRMANGRGESFRIAIRDSSGSINCKFFYQFASQFYHLIEVGNVYEFQGGVVHVSSYQSNVRSPYEIIFSNNPIITHINDGAADEEDQTKILDIAAILNRPEFTEVNVLAVVKDPGVFRVLNLRNGQQRAQLNVTLVDSSEREIKVTIWGNEAENIRFVKGEICLLVKLLVKTYNGSKFLEWQSSISRSFCDDFQTPQYAELLEWKSARFENYITQNDVIEVPFISQDTAPREYVTLAELKQRSQEFFAEAENRSRRLLFDTTAIVSNIGWRTSYKACKQCMKSVFAEHEGNYYCRECRTITGDYLTRFKGEIQMVDGTSWLTATAFGETNCATLFQKTSVELENLERTSREAYRRLLRSSEFIEMYFTICAKINTFAGRETLSFMIVSCVSTATAAAQLIPRIRDRLGINN